MQRFKTPLDYLSYAGEKRRASENLKDLSVEQFIEEKMPKTVNDVEREGQTGQIPD